MTGLITYESLQSRASTMKCQLHGLWEVDARSEQAGVLVGPGESKRGPRLLSLALGDLAQLDADDRGRASCNQRRLTPKGRATRDRIAAVAAQLMLERGVGSTSVAAVHEAAGVGASQVHHYFGDKQSLVKAVIAYNTNAVLGTVRPPTRPARQHGRTASLAGPACRNAA